MKNTLRLNHAERTIVMDKTFAKFAANTMSPEYAHLQQERLPPCIPSCSGTSARTPSRNIATT